METRIRRHSPDGNLPDRYSARFQRFRQCEVVAAVWRTSERVGTPSGVKKRRIFSRQGAPLPRMRCSAPGCTSDSKLSPAAIRIAAAPDREKRKRSAIRLPLRDDLLVETLNPVFNALCQHVIVVLVADEHHELVVGRAGTAELLLDGFCNLLHLLGLDVGGEGAPAPVV
jgi:hypothetical protein